MRVECNVHGIGSDSNLSNNIGYPRTHLFKAVRASGHWNVPLCLLVNHTSHNNGHGRVITYHRFKWIWLLNHTLIWINWVTNEINRNCSIVGHQCLSVSQWAVINSSICFLPRSIKSHIHQIGSSWGWLANTDAKFKPINIFDLHLDQCVIVASELMAMVNITLHWRGKR